MLSFNVETLHNLEARNRSVPILELKLIPGKLDLQGHIMGSSSHLVMETDHQTLGNKTISVSIIFNYWERVKLVRYLANISNKIRQS